MSVKITYLVHGTTTDNENNISSGWKDVELSELGIKQSKELLQKIIAKEAHLKETKTIEKENNIERAKNIENETKNETEFDVIFCSDLKRAVDSAYITWGGSGVPIIQDERLRECNYGDYNGMNSDIVEPLQEENVYKRFSNGESYSDVKIRIESFLNFLKDNYKEKHIAIVAHKAPQLCLDVILKDMTFKQAFTNDWRKTKSWQPGWEYEVK